MQLDDLFTRAQELPSIPKVVQELIQSFNDDSVDIDSIAKKIGMDQVLTAKVMRLANSAKYGGTRQVSSVNDAVVRLGFNSLRTLVLACAFISAFRAPEGFDINKFWRDSFGIAELCRWLSRYSSIDTETAFTCGMLSNVGRLMVAVMLPESALEIQREVNNGGSRREQELDHWGFTSDEAGAKMAALWKFPNIIVEGIQHQSAPLDAQESTAMPCLVHLANFLHEAYEQNQSDDQIIAAFPRVVAQAGEINVAPMLDHLAECRGLDSGIDSLLS